MDNNELVEMTRDLNILNKLQGSIFHLPMKNYKFWIFFPQINLIIYINLIYTLCQ